MGRLKGGKTVCQKCRRCQRYVRLELCFGCWCGPCYHWILGSGVDSRLVLEDVERERRIRHYEERAAAGLPLFLEPRPRLVRTEGRRVEGVRLVAVPGMRGG